MNTMEQKMLWSKALAKSISLFFCCVPSCLPQIGNRAPPDTVFYFYVSARRLGHEAGKTPAILFAENSRADNGSGTAVNTEELPTQF